MIVIKNCNCDHDFQDKNYGTGKRVHNSGDKHITCTVCGTKKTL